MCDTSRFEELAAPPARWEKGRVSDEREALEALIDAAPDDPRGYAVLGDWYQQRGDPRGELIALQLDPHRENRKWREREEALLFTRGLRIAQVQRAQWRWGFVHTLLFELTRHKGWEAHLDDWPEVMLGRELGHPSCRFLRELVVDASPGDLALRYLDAHPPRHLRALTCISNELDLSLFGPGLAGLEKLSVSAQLVTPAALPLPRLASLALPLDTMSVAGARLVLGSVAASLEALVLTSPDALAAGDLEPAFELPALRALTVRSEHLGRGAVEALVAAPIAQTLETLDLSQSGITGDAAQRLLKLAPRFPKLSSLVLGQAVDAP